MSDNEVRVALGFYSVCHTVKKPEDYIDAYKKIRAMGYKYIEISPKLPFPADEYNKITGDLGLSVCGMHADIDMMRNEFDKTVKIANSVNCKYITIPHPLKMPGLIQPKSVAEWKKIAKDANELGKKYFENGITLQYHNHYYEFIEFDGKIGMDIIYGETDPKYLKAQIDTHWVLRGGANPSEWILKMKGRTEQIHLKDAGVNSEGKLLYMAVGEGNLDWESILKACRECGIKDYIVEIDPNDYTPDPYLSVETAIKNIVKMGLISKEDLI